MFPNIDHKKLWTLLCRCALIFLNTLACCRHYSKRNCICSFFVSYVLKVLDNWRTYGLWNMVCFVFFKNWINIIPSPQEIHWQITTYYWSLWWKYNEWYNTEEVGEKFNNWCVKNAWWGTEWGAYNYWWFDAEHCLRNCTHCLWFQLCLMNFQMCIRDRSLTVQT